MDLFLAFFESRENVPCDVDVVLFRLRGKAGKNLPPTADDDVIIIYENVSTSRINYSIYLPYSQLRDTTSRMNRLGWSTPPNFYF